MLQVVRALGEPWESTGRLSCVWKSNSIHLLPAVSSKLFYPVCILQIPCMAHRMWRLWTFGLGSWPYSGNPLAMQWPAATATTSQCSTSTCSTSSSMKLKRWSRHLPTIPFGVYGPSWPSDCGCYCPTLRAGWRVRSWWYKLKRMVMMLTIWLDIFLYKEFYLYKAILKWKYMESSRKLLGSYRMFCVRIATLPCNPVMGFIFLGIKAQLFWWKRHFLKNSRYMFLIWMLRTDSDV